MRWTRERTRIAVIVVAVAIGSVVMSRLLDSPADAVGHWLASLLNPRTATTVSFLDETSGSELILSVPKAYMVRWPLARNPKGAIRIETRFPELEPAEATPRLVGEPGSSEYARSMEEIRNGVAIRIDNAYVDPTAGAHERQRERFSGNTRSSGNYDAYELVDADAFGLLHYSTFFCQPSRLDGDQGGGRTAWNCRETYEDNYLNRDATVHIVCNVWNLPALAFKFECTAQTWYRGFQMTYVFRHSELERWQEFDSGVRRLLDSFVVDD